MENFVIIGAGNVAWHLSKALVKAGLKPRGVFSRNKEKAQELADCINCEATDDLNKIWHNADLYIFAVKDNALEEIINRVKKCNQDALYLHTAGCVSIEVFKNKFNHYGVLYPLQSFTKKRFVDFNKIPIFVEGNDLESTEKIKTIAKYISKKPITVLNSEKRRYMHLAAVFASNFTNHCYACAAEIVEKSGIPFSVLLPLIEETCNKVHEISPLEAQTGPAVRYDTKVMKCHESLLQDKFLEIYHMMSESIHEMSVSKK